MKKVYQKPQIDVLQIETAQLLTISGGDNGDGRPAQSRQNNFYFNEEDY